jgi:hypothetical protein
LLQCPPEKSKEEEEEEVAAEMFEELLKLRCGRHTIWRQRSAWKKRHYYSSSSSAMLTINILIHVENFLNRSQNFFCKQTTSAQ